MNICFLLLSKKMFFGKQKFGVKQLKLDKFIFDVKYYILLEPSFVSLFYLITQFLFFEGQVRKYTPH